MEKTKYEKYHAYSKYLIGVGLGIIVIVGMPFLVYALSLHLDERCHVKYDCQTLDLTYQIPLNDKEVILMKGVLKFRSLYEFGVDNKIEYIVKIATNNPNLVKSMNFLIGFQDEDFSKYGKTIEQIQTNAKSDSRLIDLKKNGNHLERDGFWVSPIEQKIVLKPYIVDHTGNLIIMNATDPIADLKSFGNVKQAESNYISNVSNFTLIGLSWVGVGAIPLALGMEIKFRIELRESEVNKWFKNKED